MVQMLQLGWSLLPVLLLCAYSKIPIQYKILAQSRNSQIASVCSWLREEQSLKVWPWNDGRLGRSDRPANYFELDLNGPECKARQLLAAARSC
jgi:hypothetical protein